MSEINAVAKGHYCSVEGLQAAVNSIRAECNSNAEALRFIAEVLGAYLRHLDGVERSWFTSGPTGKIKDHLLRTAAAQEASGNQVQAAWDSFQKRILEPANAAANQTASIPDRTFAGVPRPNRRSA